MSEIIFSIIIPTFRRPEILAKTLQCLERQECDFPFEVIVVNDGPPEELPELGFGEGKRTNWRLIQNESNLKRAATRNRGIKAAQGDYVLMIDDDIWAVPGLLQAHYEKQKEIGGGVVVGALPPANEIENTPWHRYIARRFERAHERLKMENIDFGLFLTGNVSVPRVILEECGGFDESFKDYSYEDSELGYRLHQNGTCFSHEPNAIGYHFFSEPLNKICAKAYDSGRSLEVFIRLHPELYLKMQLGSITILPWRGIDIIKNIIKMILFFSCTREALKLLVKCLGKTNCDPFIFPFIPWLELAFSAKGVRAGRLKMTQ